MKKYFNYSEFDCPTTGKGSGEHFMDKDFLNKLNYARYLSEVYYGVPFPIVRGGGYRSVEHEHRQGRSGTSSHTKGIAVDIDHGGNEEKEFSIYSCLISAGFNRFGFMGTSIHVDSDKTKPQYSAWDYSTTNYKTFPVFDSHMNLMRSLSELGKVPHDLGLFFDFNQSLLDIPSFSEPYQ